MFRRRFLQAATAAFQPDAKLPPVRALTSAPGHHWFGYYDKLEFDPSGRYVLGMRVDFEHRSPRPDDVIEIGMVDTAAADRWITLGQSRAWCWQQGAMLQWIPGSKTKVIWNDRDGDHFVARVLDVHTHKLRTLPAPIYALSPDGAWGFAPNFARLQDCRPGYGYVGAPDPNKAVAAPEDDGIWRMDLRTGAKQLIIPYAAARSVPHATSDLADAKHWFNHLLVSPDGKRFVFLHRWRAPRHGQGWETRMFTASTDGKDLFVLNPANMTSHFIWRDARHVLAWAAQPGRPNHFYLFEDVTRNVEVIGDGVMTVDGHCTYSADRNWVLCDTYPDRERKQNPYLFDLRTGVRHPLGHFHLPAQYSGEWRCDLHPRFSPDGRKVVIDSAHGGTGRQLYMIDVAGVVG